MSIFNFLSKLFGKQKKEETKQEQVFKKPVRPNPPPPQTESGKVLSKYLEEIKSTNETLVEKAEEIKKQKDENLERILKKHKDTGRRKKVTNKDHRNTGKCKYKNFEEFIDAKKAKCKHIGFILEDHVTNLAEIVEILNTFEGKKFNKKTSVSFLSNALREAINRHGLGIAIIPVGFNTNKTQGFVLLPISEKEIKKDLHEIVKYYAQFIDDQIDGCKYDRVSILPDRIVLKTGSKVYREILVLNTLIRLYKQLYKSCNGHNVKRPFSLIQTPGKLEVNDFLKHCVIIDKQKRIVIKK